MNAGKLNRGGEEMRHLTPREKEVLVLLCDGLKNTEVAQKLGMATKTVETHRANIMRKTGCRNIAELFRWAIKTGHVKV